MLPVLEAVAHRDQALELLQSLSRLFLRETMRKTLALQSLPELLQLNILPDRVLHVLLQSSERIPHRIEHRAQSHDAVRLPAWLRQLARQLPRTKVAEAIHKISEDQEESTETDTPLRLSPDYEKLNRPDERNITDAGTF